MEKHSTIFVAGHKGLVGSAIVRKLKEQGYTNIITRNRQQCDLTNPIHVKALFEENEIDYVFDLQNWFSSVQIPIRGYVVNSKLNYCLTWLFAFFLSDFDLKKDLKRFERI